jgi:hypothetical protein
MYHRQTWCTDIESQFNAFLDSANIGGKTLSVGRTQLTRAEDSLCDECLVPWDTEGALDHNIEEVWSSPKDDQSDFCQEAKDGCPTTPQQQNKSGKLPLSPISEVWSYIDDMDDIVGLIGGWPSRC